jgi:hypothetical protein
VSAFVSGYKTGSPVNWSSYIIQPFEHTTTTINQLNIGLLNSFVNYSFEITISSFRYVATGPAPESITDIPSSTFTTMGTTLDDYSVTNATNFLYRTAFYKTDNSSFNYYAPQGYTTKHHDPISPDIASKYNIDVSKLEYYATELMVKGRSYTEWIRSQTDATYDQTQPFEQATVLGY